MDHVTWVDDVLHKLAGAGPEGEKAVAFIQARRVKIGFRRQGEATGAMWWLDGNLYLNPAAYSDTTDPDDAYMLSLIAHEAMHLQQGLVTALSVFGELQGWQAGFRVLKALDPAQIVPVLDEILALPLNWDRAVLNRAADLMVQYDPGYQIHRLPLYPLFREIWYWLTKKSPN
jgi:hypothetical protein